MGITILDDRGRITIPKSDRKKLGLRPGDKLWVEVAEEGIRIRKTVSLKDFIRIFEGCITKENAVGKAADPLRIKEIWQLAVD
jgi:AbrB family looped-hinge helix DNA binding protein